MLLSLYETLRKIDTGVKHKAEVLAMPHEHGLEVRVEITCTKNREKYCVTKIFTIQEMMREDFHERHENHERYGLQNFWRCWTAGFGSHRRRWRDIDPQLPNFGVESVAADCGVCNHVNPKKP